MKLTLEEHGSLVESWLADGQSYRQMAISLGCHHSTVMDFVKRRLTGDDQPPRLLVVDIETMANLAWVWGNWQQDIRPAQIVKHKRTISFAAKWVGEKTVCFRSEFHDGREAMVRHAWDLLDQADAVIGYNSKRFDIKHLNSEFKLLGLDPYQPFQHIDLLQVTKREFAWGSNKLEAVADRLGLGRKREHEGFALWIKCEAEDPDAWKRMRDYNRNDVVLTEKLFEDYREWIPLRGTQSQRRLREVMGIES